jgi:ribonucleoside-diphosphate reductase beta chain
MDLKERATDDADRVATATLKELGDIRIDDVLAFIDRGIESMPSYMDLYRRWEKQPWAVADLDFGPDRENWLGMSEDEKKYALWTMRLFFNGEERVTATLAPFVWAAPTPEIEVFLSTQMVDEARHAVFFDTWWRAVPGTDKADMGSLLAEVRPAVAGGYDELFYELLPGIAKRLARDPKDIDAFVEGVTMYHIVIEATLALTGQRFTLDQMRQEGNTHLGFYQGFTAVARDESRHVNFGIKFLQEAIREDSARFAPIVQRTLVDCLPLISGTLEPPDGDQRYYSDFGRSQDEVMEYAMSSLNKRLAAIGINLQA